MQSNCEDASSVFILVGTFNPLLKKIIGKNCKIFPHKHCCKSCWYNSSKFLKNLKDMGHDKSLL